MDNAELAKYLRKQILELKWATRGELVTKMTTDALEFWIQQFKTRDSVGHSAWSERYQKNVWIESK